MSRFFLYSICTAILKVPSATFDRPVLPQSKKVVCMNDFFKIIWCWLWGLDLERLGSLTAIITSVVVTFVAIWGLWSWKAQQKGQADHELAKRLLFALYQYKEALSGVREPVMVFYLNQTKVQLKNLEEHQLAYYSAEQDIYVARFENLEEKKSKLRTELLEAEVLWGKEFPKLSGSIDQFFDLEIELKRAVLNHLRISDESLHTESRAALLQIQENRRDVLYAPYSRETPDVYNSDVLAVMKKLEKLIRPKLTP